jgi:hypothetical protein
MPARIDWVYYEFFSKHGFVNMSDSILRRFVEYPFQVPPPNLIGIYMTNNPNNHTDTGYLGTGYMHFGIVGMLAFSLIVGVLLRIADVLTVGRMPVWMGICVTVGSFFNMFSDADISTTLATHGLGISFLLLLAYGQSRKTEEKSAAAVQPPFAQHIT